MYRLMGYKLGKKRAGFNYFMLMGQELEFWIGHCRCTMSLSVSATEMKLSNLSDDCSLSLWPRLIRLCKNRNISPNRFLCLTFFSRDIFGHILTKNLWNRIWEENLWNYIFFQLASIFPSFLLLSGLLQLSERWIAMKWQNFGNQHWFSQNWPKLT